MAKNTSFSLGEDDEVFLEAEVSAGNFSNRSDVVREALRRMREDAQKRAELERLLDEGIRDIEAGRTVTHGEVWSEIRDRRRARKKIG